MQNHERADLQEHERRKIESVAGQRHDVTMLWSCGDMKASR